MPLSRTSLLLSVLLLSSCVNEAGIDIRAVEPTVEIVAPGSNEHFSQLGEGIQFEGRVDDSRDLPEELDVLWILNQGEEAAQNVAATVASDGTVTGSVEVSELPVGNHTLTLRATDTDDAVGVATVGFRVGEPPQVMILNPEDLASFDPGDSVTFQGEAADSTTAADDLVFEWSSDRDGVLDGELSGDGQSVLVTDALSTGTHVITLTATDEDDESGTAAITVSVAEVVTKAEPGDLVFSEMMVNPQVVADEVGEWVELYNTSGSPIEVSGYTFRDDDNDSWVLEGSMVVEPYDYFVLCADLDPSVNGGVPCDARFNRDYEGNGMALANNPDELVLARPDGVEIDWLHYTNAWWVAGAAIGVDPEFLDGGSNDDPSHWCVQDTVIMSGGEAGTPGFENDPCGG